MNDSTVSTNKSSVLTMTARSELNTFENERIDQRQTLIGLNHKRKKVKFNSIKEGFNNAEAGRL